MFRELKLDNLGIEVFETREEMGEQAGKDIAAYMRELLETQETVNVMFAAAPSQNETLKTLCSQNLPWERVNAFHMVESVGLDAGHPSGFRNYLKRTIFDRFTFCSVNLIDGNAKDPEQAVNEYDALLRDMPLDICILGIGENGHLAFNDPGVAMFDDPVRVKVVELDEMCRMQQVHDGCFEDISQVPTHALTVTVPALCAAKRMFCSVPGPTKAEAVKRMVNGAVDETCPATILRRHASAVMYLDRDSAKEIL